MENCNVRESDFCGICYSCQLGAVNPEDIHRAGPQLPKGDIKLNHMAIWNTSACNLRCRYCFVFDNEKNKVATAVIEDEVIDALPAFYEKYFNTNMQNLVYFFGGEPLVAFKQMQVTYNKLKNYNIKWTLTSNLTNLTEEKAEWLGERGFTVLCSIDGTPEANASRVHKNGKPSWEEAIRGLKLVRKHLLALPEIRSTVNPATIPYVYDSFMFFVEQGLSVMATEPNYETKWTPEDVTALMEQHQRVAEFIVHHKSRQINYKPLTDTMNVLKNQNPGNTFWKQRCGLAQTGVAVDTDGSIFSCHRFVSDHNSELKIGNVFTGIDEKEKSKLTAQIYKYRPYNVDDVDRCQHCLYERLCSGGCLCINKELTGEGYLVPNIFCDIQNAQMKALAPYALDMNNAYLSPAPMVSPVINW